MYASNNSRKTVCFFFNFISVNFNARPSVHSRPPPAAIVDNHFFTATDLAGSRQSGGKKTRKIKNRIRNIHPANSISSISSLPLPTMRTLVDVEGVDGIGSTLILRSPCIVATLGCARVKGKVLINRTAALIV